MNALLDWFRNDRKKAHQESIARLRDLRESVESGSIDEKILTRQIDEDGVRGDPEEIVTEIAKSITYIRTLADDHGDTVCPRCQETLRYIRFENGHVHGICETKGCLRWMQ